MDNNMIEILREYFKTQPVEKAWIFGSFSAEKNAPTATWTS